MFIEPATVDRSEVTGEIKLTFFFNGGHRKDMHLWTELWRMTKTCSLSPVERQNVIVEARRRLLPPRVYIVKSKLTGSPLLRFTDKQGTANGIVTFPFSGYTLRNCGRDAGRGLRAVPRELVDQHNCVELADFSRALRQAGAVIWRDDTNISISRVEQLSFYTRFHDRLETANQTDLKDALKKKWAMQVWAETKPVKQVPTEV